MLHRREAGVQAHERVLHDVLSGTVVVREQPREPDGARIRLPIEARELRFRPPGISFNASPPSAFMPPETPQPAVSWHSFWNQTRGRPCSLFASRRGESRSATTSRTIPRSRVGQAPALSLHIAK